MPEQSPQQHCVVVVASEDDGFPYLLAITDTNAILHEVSQNGPVSVFVVNLFVDLGVLIIQKCRVFTVLFQSPLLLIRKVVVLDAFA